jgi:hypothetical protein
MAAAFSSTFVIYLADCPFEPSAASDVQKLYTAVHQAFPRPPVINQATLRKYLTCRLLYAGLTCRQCVSDDGATFHALVRVSRCWLFGKWPSTQTSIQSFLLLSLFLSLSASILLCKLAHPLIPTTMPTESPYPRMEIPDVGLWDFLFERKDRPYPDDHGMLPNQDITANV